MSLPNSVKDREYQKFKESEQGLVSVNNIPSGDHVIPYKRVIQLNGTQYIGETYAADPENSGNLPVWRVSQVATLSDGASTIYAGSGGFNQIFDNYLTLFPTIPFFSTKSVFLDGVNDYIDFGDAADIEFSQPFTFSGWVQVRNLGGTNYFLIDKRRVTGNEDGYQILIRFNGRVQFNLGSTSTDLLSVESTSPTFTSNTWYHLLVKHDGSGTAAGVTIKINNVTATKLTIDTPVTGSTVNELSLKYGVSNDNANPYQGFINNFSLWNIHMTDVQDTELFNDGSPADLFLHSAYIADNANLVFWHKLGNGDTYPIVLDNYNGVDGEIINATSAAIQDVAP